MSRTKIQGECPPGETCDLEEILIEEIGIVDEGAVDKANVTIKKRKGDNMTLKEAAKQAHEALSKVDEPEEDKLKKRLKLLQSNLKSLAGVSKGDDTYTDLQTQLKSITEQFKKLKDEIDAVKSNVETYGFPGKKEKKPKDYEEKPEDYYEETKKDLTDELETAKELASEGYIKPDELANLLSNVGGVK